MILPTFRMFAGPSLCAVRYFTKGFPASVKAESENMGDAEWKNAESVYAFTVNDIQGNPVSLEKYRGHVLLIVNVASKCGFTASNYKELAELDEKYRESKGLRILAFPCNQFSNQEPGSAEDIVCFAKKKNANFDMFEKIEVNGRDAHPLWKYLKLKQPGTFGDKIKWNFSKFIVDKEGQPVARFSPNTVPSKIVPSLEKYF
ncbi:probable phospholipid hydroperoxide glutathione peroxidase isoform X2 [Nilaparvata lugens]|uniref:probable phospholipid hydroperoxide glutathione peroxidase isoform X2 n=1 Tax=Nilaparvata lugens TaxID=108931 RepID=UPI00193D2988|nr:probable phospholipid hydroperoxide glutathione peroxidase isoform X2 [Nilaparvata lugens]XP_039278355.1 probable phospholipid hydroperoxide glutathione peroxidase isoform X2 [Nilaparvata lugens]XP_039278357.1 probable phospholipid hydroperoxide glutathione peroxidase isoform X2 [Nilaparvata lugens]XP_039278358.1 probable phospholipid hydroperoxide glutathione peroxidase isoform X2 [Nilaparvata lugens]